MSYENIIRAWKDASYCEGLSEVERSLLPHNPAGVIELTDLELGAVVGMRVTCRAGCDPTECALPYSKGECCGGGGGGGGGGGCGLGTAFCTQQFPCC
jgi:mersacidin/lichenicidin family type 2 lantibiotic